MVVRTNAISEIVGASPQDVNTAIRNGIKRASETARNLDWFELVEVPGAITNGHLSPHPVTHEVGFTPEGSDDQ